MDPQTPPPVEQPSQSPQQPPVSFQPAALPPRPKVGWVLRKQLTYLLFLLIIASLGGYGVYTRVAPKPTCSDRVKKQNETGVDCGGVRARICANQVEDLKVEWSKVFPSATGSYDAAALILNPNLAVGLSKLHYRFTLFDAQNKLLAEREGDTFVNPGERFALYEPSIVTGDRVPLRGYVQFEDPDYVLPWRKAVLPLRPELSVDNTQLRGGQQAELIGQLANRSIADAVGVQAIAVLLDGDEKPIGVRSSYFDSLKRNDAIPLSFSWNNVADNQSPSNGKVFPRATAEGIK